MYHLDAAQGDVAVGVATIFEKMSCFLGFLQERGGISPKRGRRWQGATKNTK